MLQFKKYDALPFCCTATITVTALRLSGWSDRMQSSLKSSLVMGVACAGVGAITGVLVVNVASGKGYGWFLVAAPLAGFLAGGTFWRLVAQRNKRSVLAGAFAGALAGTASHFLCWYLVFAATAVCYALTSRCTDSLGDPPANLLQALVGAAVYSGVSLFFFGWLTIPAGGLLGALLAWLQRRTHSSPSP
ncbi:MAG: hypothetical protein HPY59_18445 [Anaerolineae bacterium]|nr:hypothetical protein [Anaerolineae bacterium]